MRRTSIGTRSLMRAGASAAIVALVISITSLPAAAGTPPSISGFSPSSGPVGTSVAISGANLAGATQVAFNGHPTTPILVNGTGTQITVNVPTGATDGPISVSTPNGDVSSSSSFDVTSGAIPVINGFLPASGAVGATVHVYGANFTGATAVRFNGHSATPFTIIGPGNIQTTVPAGATSGRITVTTPAGTGTSATDFMVTAGAIPVINGFLPTSGAVGATVHVYGANFTGATAVRFNGHSATPFTIIGPGNIQTTVPAGATSGRITVTTPAGMGTSATNFTVTGGGLTITSFSPTSGGAGTAVVINGTGFTNVSAVKFNGKTATFTVANATRINTTVPTGATTGKISVTTTAGTVTSTGTFTVVGPKINSLSPNAGPVGMSIAIFGTSFTGVTSVRFNGVSATFTLITASQVNATVPGGATTGRVTLTTPSGTATSPANFTVTASAHQRAVSLFLGRRATRAQLFANGSVSVNDGYSACLRNVPVVIKRFHRGGWRWVTTTSTGQNGGFRTPIANRAGRYRAKALKVTLVNGAVCGGRLSNVVRHHR